MEITNGKAESFASILTNKAENFMITFSDYKTEKTIHIPYKDVPKIADILNDFLKSKGIESYVEFNILKYFFHGPTMESYW